jgi:hypothetical protein
MKPRKWTPSTRIRGATLPPRQLGMEIMAALQNEICSTSFIALWRQMSVTQNPSRDTIIAGAIVFGRS